MSEQLPDHRSAEPITVDPLVGDLHSLGVDGGDTVLVHSSLSSLGWVCGGPPAVIDALQRVVGEAGTIVMPTHTANNSEPSKWTNPPVPDDWYGTIRSQLPPYRPASTPTFRMGAIAECFRTYPDVHRSDHPHVSFAAWGADARRVTDDHSLGRMMGEGSPLASVYDLDGHVLLLGTSHTTNTSLHLAECRADIDHPRDTKGSAVLVDGAREWIEWADIDYDAGDFPACGEAFEAGCPDAFEEGTVGVGQAKRISHRQLVDFAVDWFERTR